MEDAIHQSDNLLIIRLQATQLEDIVERKLIYFLKTESSPSYLLDQLYKPVEQALIEAVLRWKEGNQIQTAKTLGINRNTLRKKLQIYNINPVNLSAKPLFRVGRELFLTQIESLDLLEVSRFKFCFIKKEQNQENNLVQKFCAPVEKTIIFTVLRHFKYNQMKAAKSLGINRNTLKKKLSVYNILWKSRRIQTGA
ncbi:MAG: hypothetical protein OXB86_04840 [Bdellovibrionales bacterium]|nr:hypothetical protein [Bdellovibrionales bacterium]